MAELYSRDLGKHDAQIESLKADVHELRQDVHAMRKDLAMLNSTIAQAQGGWKVLASIGLLSGGAGALMSKMFGQQ